MTKTVNVICMKWGKGYRPDYVNVLKNAVAAHLSRPHRFICLTDDTTGLQKNIETFPIPSLNLPPERIRNGGWPKLAVFQKNLYDLAGPALFLDVDIVICGQLDPFFQQTDGLAIIREWPQIARRMRGETDFGGNSSVFLFEIGKQSHIHQQFSASPDAAFRAFRNEQRFLSAHAQGLRYWHDEWCLSFKKHCIRPFPLNLFRPPRTPPASARIVAFHGLPNPTDLVTGGAWGRGLKRGRGAVPWVRDYWQRNDPCTSPSLSSQ